jgi:hypothetical protein
LILISATGCALLLACVRRLVAVGVAGMYLTLFADITLTAPWYAPSTDTTYSTLDKVVGRRVLHGMPPARFLPRYGARVFPDIGMAVPDLQRHFYYPIFAQYSPFVLKEFDAYLGQTWNCAYTNDLLFSSAHFLSQANVRFSDFSSDYFTGSSTAFMGEALYEAPAPLPRAFLTCSTFELPTLDRVSHLLFSRTTVWPTRTTIALTAEDARALEASTLDATSTGTCVIVEYTPNRIVVHTESEKASLLVVGDTWYPNWRATVDGSPVTVHRANIVLRTVRVPAGSHQVIFLYHDPFFIAGLWIACTACMLVFILYICRAYLSGWCAELCSTIRARHLALKRIMPSMHIKLACFALAAICFVAIGVAWLLTIEDVLWLTASEHNGTLAGNAFTVTNVTLTHGCYYRMSLTVHTERSMDIAHGLLDIISPSYDQPDSDLNFTTRPFPHTYVKYFRAPYHLTNGCVRLINFSSAPIEFGALRIARVPMVFAFCADVATSLITPWSVMLLTALLFYACLACDFFPRSTTPAA